MRALAIAGLALVAACATVPAANSYFVREGMVEHINPPTEAIWNLQVEVMDDNGNFDPALMDDAKWATLTANAARLDEQAQRMAAAEIFVAADPAGDLTDPPEGTDLAAIQARLDAEPQAYRAFAQAMAVHTGQLHQAALARDAARVTTLVNDLQPVCKACHDVFWYPEEYAD
ncbi:MAG: cytochrome c [Erythrobacter sp.]|nr:MAG: cytochrome c [Erythrobacter sp.]